MKEYKLHISIPAQDRLATFKLEEDDPLILELAGYKMLEALLKYIDYEVVQDDFNSRLVKNEPSPSNIT